MIQPTQGGKALKAYRDRDRKIQPDLAKAFGVDVSTISRWESGVSRPGMGRAYQIYLETGIPVTAWMEPAA